MAKKTMILALVASAFAAFSAPTAIGSPLLTENSVALKKGADVTATTVNARVFMGANVLNCEQMTIHSEVTANSITTSELQSTAFQIANCVLEAEGGGELPVIIEEFAAVMDFVKEGKGSGAVTFFATIAGLIKCHFAGTPAMAYASGTKLFTFDGKLGVAGTGCATEGTFQANYDLETENAEPVRFEQP